MATITDAQSALLRQFLHAECFNLMEAESPYLTKAQYKAALQAIDDWWEANRINLKASMDSAIGQTISNSLAKKIGKYWMREKWGLE